MEAAAAVSKMKVTDLKKELRARGLSTVGNKNELVERLQEAMECGTDNLGLEGEAGEEDFDEEEILGEEELDSELTPQEEEAALKGASIRVKEVSSLLEPEKKKISLKRNEPTPLEEPEPAPEPAAEPETPATPPADVPAAAEEAAPAAPDATAPPPKKIIKLGGGSTEKDLKARAERFGIPLTDEARKEARKARFGSSNGTESGKTEEEKRVARAARFGLGGGGGGGGGGGKISMEGEKVEIDQLMKRAERFGEVTSPALLKATEEEKKKQRVERFGATPGNEGKKIAAVEAPTDEALAKRKERFGIIDEEEKKRKRAERFAI